MPSHATVKKRTPHCFDLSLKKYSLLCTLLNLASHRNKIELPCNTRTILPVKPFSEFETKGAQLRIVSKPLCSHEDASWIRWPATMPLAGPDRAWELSTNINIPSALTSHNMTWNRTQHRDPVNEGNQQSDSNIQSLWALGSWQLAANSPNYSTKLKVEIKCWNVQNLEQ